ncbi:PIN domain-containing protein [candidate division KSB1 bacterium]|nr:PIN domain-containing protein [candidate division KSB1 bacterium]
MSGKWSKEEYNTIKQRCDEQRQIDWELWERYFSSVKKAGTPVPTNDIWIAVSAMEKGLAVFTLDKNFEKVAGLRLY